MGYEFNKEALNAQRKYLDMSIDDFAFNLGISKGYLMSLLYSKKKALTISDKILRALDHLGVSDLEIEVDRKSPRKRGRPRKHPRCPRCGK